MAPARWVGVAGAPLLGLRRRPSQRRLSREGGMAATESAATAKRRRDADVTRRINSDAMKRGTRRRSGGECCVVENFGTTSLLARHGLGKSAARGFRGVLFCKQ